MSQRSGKGTSAALAAVSFLICVTAGGCWVRSYLGETWRIGSIPGGLAFASMNAGEPFLKEMYGDYDSSRTVVRSLYGSANARTELLGFKHAHGTLRGMSFWLVAVPYWFIVLLTAAPPADWWRQQRRARHRKVEGRCPGCGYDLRGTPERCPECGWTKSPAAATTT